MRRIEVVPYNPEWPAMFRHEAELLRAIFGPAAAAIHHIGSTAVPGLHAKPTIDILLEARDLEAIDGFNPQMERHGYLPRGEFGLPGRRHFSKGSDEHRTHYVHCFQHSTLQATRFLAFRDYLIEHPAEARAYAELKIRLARQFPANIDAYMDGKDAWIKEAERRALRDWTRINAV